MAEKGWESRLCVSTHSRPKAAGVVGWVTFGEICLFQLTAARRRLVAIACKGVFVKIVSTHSRPKAAGVKGGWLYDPDSGFNSQPPEGGWI